MLSYHHLDETAHDVVTIGPVRNRAKIGPRCRAY